MAGAAVALGVAALLLASSTHTSFSLQVSAREGQLIWNANEAYLAVQVTHFGWRRSYLRVLLDSFMVLSKYGAAARELTRSNIVFRIGPTTLQKHDSDQVTPTLTFYLLDDKVSDGYGVWSGDKFQPLAPTQKRDLVAMPRTDFSDWRGWSGRRFTPDAPRPHGERIPFRVGQSSMALVVSGDVLVSAAIALERGDAPAQPLWSVDERMRFVSKTEYVAIFGE
jgi:hypothetical protein